MDGNVAVQRATAWWESFGSDSARRAPEVLAGLFTDLASAIEEVSERQKKASGLLSGLSDLVQSRAQTVLDRAPSQVQSFARVASNLKAAVGDTDSGDRFRMVFDNAAVAIAVATGEVESKIIDVNPAFVAMFNRTADVLRGRPIAGFTKVEAIANQLRDWISRVETDGGTRRFEVPYRKSDGERGWALFIMTYVAATAAEASYVLAVAQDITGQRSRAEELQWQATHDPLTGLPNRRFLQKELESAIAQSAEGELAGLCFIDLDDFKTVNDTYGHTVGDQTLCEIAERLATAARQSGDVVIRLGGDEFVVLVPPPATEATVVELARRLVAVLEDPVQVEEHSVLVRASIGVDLVDLRETDLSKVLEGADKALYRTKAEGLGVVVFQR